MVVLEQPPVIDETENEEDIRQEEEVQVITCTCISVCIVKVLSLVHNMESSSCVVRHYT